MMNKQNFKVGLYQKIKASLDNNYGKENYDIERYGENREKFSIKSFVKRKIGFDELHFKLETYEKINEFLFIFGDSFENLYSILEDSSKELLIELIAFRLLGYKKVKLSVNNSTYREAAKIAKNLIVPGDNIDPNCLHFILKKMDLRPINYDILLYLNEMGVIYDYILEQYAFKLNGKRYISADKNDYVLDIGGCWGDTALYFAHNVGENGKVFSFEFIPSNVEIHNTNLSLNAGLKKRIELIKNPVTIVSDKIVYFKDQGPGSRIEFEPFSDYSGTTTTITIDDFVMRNNIDKIDFIKMDIEGSELDALKGAIGTIKKFKPKLAIAVYHSMDDLVNIPLWIKELNLDYEIYLGHYTIHSEETVCFAKINRN